MNQFKTKYSLSGQKARMFAERVYILLKAGRYEAARSVIDEAESTKQDVKNAPLSDMPIACLDMDDKIINLFEKMQYKTVQDLIGVSDEHLLKTVPMCGEKSISTLRQAIAKEITKRRKPKGGTDGKRNTENIF
jgi:DNA-directed RNA polymerase alpha subunit